MEKFDNKQKLILGALGVILIIVVIIYIFKRDTTSTAYSEYENLYISNVDDSSVLQEETTGEAENKIFVHIAGEVKNPGIFEVIENSRIADLIELAGGLTNKGSIEDINLAYKVEDGQKIYIPSIEETKAKAEDAQPKAKEITYVTSESGANIEGSSTSKGDSSTTESIVNINTATQTELETLSGIGPSTAQKIIDYRTENGKFKNIEDIKNVTGIGEAKFNAIKDSIKV